MPTLTDDDQKSRIDEGYDHGGGSYNPSHLSEQETAALKGIEDNYDKNADPSQENDNIARAREAESSGWSTNVSQSDAKSRGKLSLNKNKGPFAALIATLVGGGGILGFLFTPSLGIVQMKEILTGDLNDQLAALDIRSDHVFRAKLKDMSSGVCSSAIQIKCRFTSMSQRQVDKFRKAGFIVETADTRFGRQKITSLVAPDGTRVTNPAELTKARRTSPAIRSAMNRVYNPRFYSVSDGVANKVFAKFKTDKQKKITGSTDEERRESLRRVTAGEDARGFNGDGVQRDGERRYVTDEKNNRVYEDSDSDKFNRIRESNIAANERISNKPTTAGKAANSILRSGLRGVSIIGAADTACTVYNTARAVGAAAKVARAMQLAQFAMVILNTADSIKAGDATPEEVEYVGTMLTQIDTRETIVNENSKIEAVSDSDTIASEEPNPFYRKSAFDSPGYRVAAYNDAPILTSQSQQYMVGGGLTGTLTSVMTDIENTLGGRSAIRNTCGTIQSWWMRTIGIIGGIAAAVGSFGTSTVISIGASLAIGFALPFLESALADIVAGQVIGENIAGVEAGDAAFSGTAALLGGMSQARGLKPLGAGEIESYLATTNEIKSEVIAAETYEARNEPFNVMNQYSFLGSIARQLNPSMIKLQTGVPGTLAAINNIFSSAIQVITPGANAASGTFNPERFNRCEDEGYSDLGIDADVFCNVRYGLSSEELNMDTEEVLNYMIGYNGEDEEPDYTYINEDGTPQGDYKTFIENCVDRVDGWGEQGEEGGSIGEECFERSSPFPDKLKYFRVYTVDASINDAMDDDEAESNNSSNLAPGTPDDIQPQGEGWTIKENTDYTSVSCAPGSTLESTYDHPVANSRFNLCKMDGTGIVVNSIASANVRAMIDAAAEDGVTLNGGGFRSVETQQDVYNRNCRNGVCNPPTARPGYSQHERGLAIDFSNCGTRSTRCYQWLNQNASKFQYYNLPSEPWHWSPSGY